MVPGIISSLTIFGPIFVWPSEHGSWQVSFTTSKAEQRGILGKGGIRVEAKMVYFADKKEIPQNLTSVLNSTYIYTYIYVYSGRLSAIPLLAIGWWCQTIHGSAWHLSGSFSWGGGVSWVKIFFRYLWGGLDQKNSARFFRVTLLVVLSDLFRG